MSVVLTITIIDDMWKTQVTEVYSINIMPYKNCNFHSKKEKKILSYLLTRIQSIGRNTYKKLELLIKKTT